MLSHSLKKKILDIIPPNKWQKHGLLLGVSGGADSVAMLRLIHDLNQELSAGPLFVCHANHRLRGNESDGDQIFVQELCERLKVPCDSFSLPLTEPVSDGIESSLRNLRYQMFVDVAYRRNARYVMTAHHAEDQAETILFRILRGTGIAGLAGIPRSRTLGDGVTLIRPLLSIRRKEIVEYLRSIDQSFRSDSSNAKLDFSRNKVRHQLIPLVEREFECDLVERLKPLSLQAGEQQQFMESYSQRLIDSAVQFSQRSVLISIKELYDQPIVILRQVLVQIWKRMNWPLQSMTSAKWNQVAELITNVDQAKPSTTLNLPGKIRVTAESDRLTFSQQ